MKYRPHKYQEFATQFIMDHKVAAVFLDMGLGKSVITLDAIKRLKDRGECGRVLIIAPKRVAVSTWPAEIRKWDFLKDLTFSVCVGTPLQRRRALEADTDIVIINRENVTWLVEESGNDLARFRICIIDEISGFKSWKSKRWKSLIKVRPDFDRVIGLTGTPGQNLMDLFAEFRVLDMGQRLTRYITQYRTRWFVPDKRNAQVVFTYKPKPGAEKEIMDAISDITVSMRAVDHLDMPEYIEGTTEVELSAEEQKKYDALRDDLVLKVKDEVIDGKNAGVLANKLSQMTGGFIYTDDGEVVKIHERKLDALEDIIEQANGQNILVAYWFKHELAAIKERFPDARELKSEQDITDWQEGKISIGLLHPMSGGHGLNLQSGGHILVFYSLTWSLDYYLQTTRRLYRQGQVADRVIIWHIVAKDTIDESVMKALKAKSVTQDMIIDAVKAEIGR